MGAIVEKIGVFLAKNMEHFVKMVHLCTIVLTKTSLVKSYLINAILFCSWLPILLKYQTLELKPPQINSQCPNQCFCWAVNVQNKCTDFRAPNHSTQTIDETNISGITHFHKRMANLKKEKEKKNLQYSLTNSKNIHPLKAKSQESSFWHSVQAWDSYRCPSLSSHHFNHPH